jgi:hypothetical protein
MPRPNPNDPPELETNLPAPPPHPSRSAARSPKMTEQIVQESAVPAPPSLELAEELPQDDPDRPWTPVEYDWYEISRRVKRIGGFCKAISDGEKRKATELMAKYGTNPEEGWSKMPHIPRLLNASHAANQKAIFEKPVKMIQVAK